MKRIVWALTSALALQSLTAGAAPQAAERPVPAVVPSGPADPADPIEGRTLEKPQAGAAACTGIAVSSIPATRGTTFSAVEILDLRFTIALRQRVAVPASFVVKVFNPNGHLYQQTSVPVARPGTLARMRNVEGSHFPVREARVNGRGAVRTVAGPKLPVGGTLISQNSLYGTWRVTAAAPGDTTACSAQFTVTP